MYYHTFNYMYQFQIRGVFCLWDDKKSLDMYIFVIPILVNHRFCDKKYKLAGLKINCLNKFKNELHFVN